MKIYHTEKETDFDALMIELDKQGCKWVTGDKMTELTRGWKEYSSETCVRVDEKVVAYSEKSYYTSSYPSVQIIKYKAEDGKIKFTKENVYRLFRDYRINKHGISVLANLESAIMDLDDTPEKVVVPKCFDEWFKEIGAIYQIPDSAKTFALWKLCQQGFGCSFEGIRGEKIPYETDLGEWLFENKMLAIDAVLNGYTIEPEPLYYIPLPHLETPDGIPQVLSKRENDKRYFASRPNENLKQRFTKEELAQVPEIYKFYATLIEVEEE